ncbi:MAG: hypothetical protein WCV92_04640 [Candidatus Buchananbacteria bacterium]
MGALVLAKVGHQRQLVSATERSSSETFRLTASFKDGWKEAVNIFRQNYGKVDGRIVRALPVTFKATGYFVALDVYTVTIPERMDTVTASSWAYRMDQNSASAGFFALMAYGIQHFRQLGQYERIVALGDHIREAGHCPSEVPVIIGHRQEVRLERFSKVWPAGTTFLRRRV